MSKLITLIKSLPFKKVKTVYLTGSENDFYRLHLVGSSENAVRVDLFKGLTGNFSNRDKSLIENGEKTQIVVPEIAVKLLDNFKSSCKYSLPNKETIDIVIQLLRNPDFTEIQKNKEKETFSSWLEKQDGRDDLIGDLVSDILKDNQLSGYESFCEIKERISNATLFSTWDVNSFRESTKKGRVNPLLVLKLAKMEYEIYIKQSKLKRFAIRDTSGFVYFFRYEEKNSPVKIGRAKNIDSRKKQLQTSSPYDIVTIGHISTKDYFELEKKIHKEHDSKRINREWFDLTEKDIIDIIKIHQGEINSEHNPV